MGFILRKSLYGRLNSLLTYEPQIYIESLKQLSDREDIIPLMSNISFAYQIMKHSNEPLHKNIFKRTRFVGQNFKYIKYIPDLLSSRSVIISHSIGLKTFSKT